MCELLRRASFAAAGSGWLLPNSLSHGITQDCEQCGYRSGWDDVARDAG